MIVAGFFRFEVWKKLENKNPLSFFSRKGLLGKYQFFQLAAIKILG